tara:strand:+ start:3966 stop:4163 length:198 start_codon:yes stop_codon:yes gene_type:complete
MEKPIHELDWHKLHRFNELNEDTQRAVVLLVNTIASHRLDDKIQTASKDALDKLRVQITYFEDTL